MLFRVEFVRGGDVLPKLLQPHFTKLSTKPTKMVPKANDIKVNNPKRIREATTSGMFAVLRPSSSVKDNCDRIFQRLSKSVGVFRMSNVTSNNQKIFLSNPYKSTRMVRMRLSGAACEA